MDQRRTLIFHYRDTEKSSPFSLGEKVAAGRMKGFGAEFPLTPTLSLKERGIIFQDLQSVFMPVYCSGG
ncbi:MAG: hypothetical protein C0622_14655 [Desulfuromonas sp.]|nr:MAG: hypothetical protein C0622_14655 [Desulfuromonas sp.]